MSNLFNRIKRGNSTFGSFGNAYKVPLADGNMADMTDEALMALYKSGDPNALAEFANRHPEIMGGQAWRRAKSLGNDPNENIGDLWLALDKAAKTYDPNEKVPAGAWANMKIGKDTKDAQLKQIQDSERNPNYDNISLEDNKGVDSGADLLGHNEDIAEKEAKVAEMKDMLAKLEKELAGMKVSRKGTTGADVINAYKVADWKNTEKDAERAAEGFARKDAGLAANPDQFLAPSVLTDNSVAKELGAGPEAFRAQKKSMLDRLPPKLKEEILSRLRGERFKKEGK